MINSMTGYGRAQSIRNGRDISVELRAVNHRYFELVARVPRSFSYLEDKIKSLVQTRVSRGKIEVGLIIVNAESCDIQIELNMELARSYNAALTRIAEELHLSSDASANSISKFPDVFSVKRIVPDEEAVWMDVRAVLEPALEQFCAMRAAEGEKLREDVAKRLGYIAQRIAEIEQQTAPRLERYRERLAQRMQTILENTEIDENRILLEAALYADKSAIDEETVRLRSHLAQFETICASGEPVGRKLDFLIQEINREINTIGSKAGDLEITGAVVDIKAEIEKIREQVQNIE